VECARIIAGEIPFLIHRAGVSRFMIVDSAPGFFDYALQRLGKQGTLNDPAGKSSAARHLGPLVAAVKDPVLREATISRICARIGITEKAFAAHLKPAAPAPSVELTETSKAIPLQLSEGRSFCRSARRTTLLKSQPPRQEVWSANLPERSSLAAREAGTVGFTAG
jgi:DNA primase